MTLPRGRKPRKPRVLWALYDEGGLYGAYQTQAQAQLVSLRAPCDDAPYRMPIVKFVEVMPRKAQARKAGRRK